MWAALDSFRKKNMRLFTLIVFTTLCFSGQAQNSAMYAVPEEASQIDLILGEWKAVNKTMKHDGSGQYDIDDQLIIKVHKILGSHGHAVDWFHTNGDYLGSTQRVYSRKRQQWLSAWFDPVTGTWSDEVAWDLSDGKLTYETKVEDETGKYQLRRVHEVSPDGKTYTYHHLRKYQGMTKWLLVDMFEAERL
jgi:hypothetical protein